MNTLAHTTLGAPAAPAAGHPDRAPLYGAVDAAPAARPIPFLTRLRHPFARREPTVKPLIRKYRLWPALEFAYDEMLREFGSVRVRMRVSGFEERFPYVWIDLRVPSEDIDLMIQLEDRLREQVSDRLGDDTSLRVSITVDPDPDYLPLFA